MVANQRGPNARTGHVARPGAAPVRPRPGSAPSVRRSPAAARADAARLREIRRVRRRRRRLIGVGILVASVAGAAAFTGGLLSAPVDFTAPAPPKTTLLLDASGRVVAAI